METMLSQQLAYPSIQLPELGTCVPFKNNRLNKLSMTHILFIVQINKNVQLPATPKEQVKCACILHFPLKSQHFLLHFFSI